jgi:class 3 adenylate cyclase
VVVCPHCGEENPERAKFCLACATPLQPPEESHERRVVSVLFCDIAGFTSIGERLDPESVRAVMAHYFSEMTTVIERHGGTVEKYIGDAIMAVFGFPRLHEDDALRAVRAAAEMRQALEPLNETLGPERDVSIAARIGVNTGEVVVGDASTRQSLIVGDAVNIAARLEQVAGPNEILIGQTTYRLIRDAVVAEAIEPLTLKGKSEPVAAWRVDRISLEAPGSLRGGRSPLVGREREESLLTDAFERVVREKRCHLVTVFGSAGVGKSRLVNEVVQIAGRDFQVLRGNCLSYGEGVAFRPLVAMISAAASITRQDSPDAVTGKIESLVSSIGCEAAVVGPLTRVFGMADATETPEEMLWAVRKLFEALARRRQLTLFFDDLHWAEPALLDLIDEIAEWSRDVSMLIVCAARPELLERRSDWGGGKLNAVSLLLSPLTPDQSQRLIDNLADGSSLPDDVRTKLIATTAGQPLFIEEMLAMFADETESEPEAGGPGGAPARLRIPETIHSLLAARIDQLPPEERRVLQAAAVIGSVFKAALLRVLVAESAEEVALRLTDLCLKDVLREDTSRLGTGDSFVFRQTLMREAAYDSVPKELRSQLHEEIARWLEREPPDTGVDTDDLLAYHLEAAYRCRAELRPGDEHAMTLAREAAGHLSLACTHAVGSAEADRARELLGRAQSLMAGASFGRDTEGAKVAAALGRAAIMVGAWGSVVDLLAPFVEQGPPEISRDLGVALCKLHRSEPNGLEYRRGQQLLETACAASPTDADALASLAGTWKGIDEAAAHRLYRQAVAVDPSDPYAWGNLLEYEISSRGDLSAVREKPSVTEAAISRCRAQADAGANLPWAFYDIGKFSLLLERPYESLAAYARAVQLSTAPFMIETSLASLEHLEMVGDELPALDAATRFLMLATAARSPGPAPDKEEVIAAAAGTVAGPVVVVVGGTSSRVEERMSHYGNALLQAFGRYEGTIISGGTTNGISHLAGDVGEHYARTIHTVGYIPQSPPEGVAFDTDERRFHELRTTDGIGFTFLQPLQYWTDVIASGIDPSQVKVIGIGGGTISAVEYRIALGLGAQVGIITDSGRAADELLKDDDWITAPNLVALQPDAEAVASFLMA